MRGSGPTRGSTWRSRGGGDDDVGELVNLEEVQAVIDSAKARGTDQLATYVRGRLADASDTEVRDAAAVLLEIIESVPLILAAAAKGAEERNLTHVVQPVLDRAVRYFLHPVDLMPEMTLGLPGLLG